MSVHKQTKPIVIHKALSTNVNYYHFENEIWYLITLEINKNLKI